MTRLFSSPAKSAAYVVAATFFVALVPAEAQNARQSASSHGGMVAAAQPLATEAGVRMLEMGGNAADAAVAAAFAIAVVEPTMNSIGGRNQILIRTPDGEIHGIDGTTQAPWDYDYDTAPQAAYGYAVIGVPGAVAGLIRLHSEYGSLPLETVMAPAIDYAENGFRVLPGDALRQAAGAAQAREFPGTRSYYLKEDGSPYRPGDLLVQRDYAATLRAIAAGGHDAFYRGEIAEKMAADLAANGSAVKLQAFHDYEAVDSRIVRGSYRGYDLVGLDVPAAGTVSIQALQIMEHFDPDAMDDEEWAAIAGQALGIASRELATLGTDSAAVRATSKAWARRMAAEVRAPAGAGVSVGTDLFPDGAPLPPLDPRGDGQGHTTHLSTADAHGMFVALTQTLGPNMGSKVATPGLGFLYASTLGGYLGRMEPGERARSFISPPHGPEGRRARSRPGGGGRSAHRLGGGPGHIPDRRRRDVAGRSAGSPPCPHERRRNDGRRDEPRHRVDAGTAGRHARVGDRGGRDGGARLLLAPPRHPVRSRHRHLVGGGRPRLGGERTRTDAAPRILREARRYP